MMLSPPPKYYCECHGTEATLQNASSTQAPARPGQPALILSCIWHANTPASVRRQPRKQQRSQRLCTPRPPRQLPARLTHANSHMYRLHSLWQKLWQEQKEKWQGVLVRRPSRGTPICDLTPPCASLQGGEDTEGLCQTQLPCTCNTLHPKALYIAGLKL